MSRKAKSYLAQLESDAVNLSRLTPQNGRDIRRFVLFAFADNFVVWGIVVLAGSATSSSSI